MTDNEVVSRIARKIRTTRLEKNLTIQELATRSHVSKGLLSKIENSRTVPSLPVFVTILQSLDISLKDFFEDMAMLNGKNYLLVKKNDQQLIPKDKRSGFEYQHIFSQNMTTCTIEATVLTLDPEAKGNPTTTDGYEFKYMLSGTCEYHLHNEIIELEEGDALYFNAAIPHLAINNSRHRAVMLAIYFTQLK